MELHNQTYDAVAVVSPGGEAGEQKDQDRASWFPEHRVACLCDGTSSSPHAGEAAEFIVQASPAIFKGDVKERLGMLCDMLLERRKECWKQPVSLPPSTPDTMRDMLCEIVAEKRKISFQTTMIAVCLRTEEKTVLLSIIRCGDSAFFAFDPDGCLLDSSLLSAIEKQSTDKSKHSCGPEARKSATFEFSPGTRLLVKIICALSEDGDLAVKTDIQSRHYPNWLVCKCLDIDRNDRADCPSKVANHKSVPLTEGDIILVPRYLVGGCNGEYSQHLYVPFSTAIRYLTRSGFAGPDVIFEQKGNVTHVLPDHFYSGSWEYLETSFPLGSHFLLASDGFYGCFQGPSEIWDWLQKNREKLNDPATSEALMHELHSKLQELRGDDDISFVWLYPKRAQSNDHPANREDRESNKERR